MGSQARIRRTAGFALLSIAIIAATATSASAQTVTFGADVNNEVPQSVAAHSCSMRPDSFGHGGWYAAPLSNSTCTWTTPTNPTRPSEGLVTPTGTGTITTVRLRVGAITGPMQLVVLNFEVNPANGNASCCNAAYVGPVFTPAANSITTLATSLPVHTDAAGQPSAGPYEVGDLLALNISPNIPIPAADYTGKGLPVNELPSDNIHWPAMVQGQTDLMGGYYGYQLDMNADWVSGTSNPPPTPTVTVAGSKPTVKHGKATLRLNCGTAAACNGTVAIENKPLPGATIAKKSKTIVYASGSFSLKAGANGKVSIPLTGKGKAAAHKRKRLTVYIDVTVGGKKISKKVTFRF